MQGTSRHDHESGNSVLLSFPCLTIRHDFAQGFDQGRPFSNLDDSRFTAECDHSETRLQLRSNACIRPSYRTSSSSIYRLLLCKAFFVCHVCDMLMYTLFTLLIHHARPSEYSYSMLATCMAFPSSLYVLCNAHCVVSTQAWKRTRRRRALCSLLEHVRLEPD